MRQKRRNFTAAFKTKVVLEALKERKTIQQLAVKFDVHPNQITTWKKQVLSNGGAAFDNSDSNSELEKTLAQLD
ncbi:MAG: transposase, partial [Balneolales bacterium]|nr:transposase [Balneolales bacterium]